MNGIVYFHQERMSTARYGGTEEAYAKPDLGPVKAGRRIEGRAGTEIPETRRIFGGAVTRVPLASVTDVQRLTCNEDANRRACRRTSFSPDLKCPIFVVLLYGKPRFD